LLCRNRAAGSAVLEKMPLRSGWREVTVDGEQSTASPDATVTAEPLPESPYDSIVTTQPVDGASTASIPSLPDGWTAATDPEGRTFYLDSTTKTTHWALPGTVNAASTA